MHSEKMTFATKIYADLVHLIFPQNCLICQNELSSLEHSICGICMIDLTFTDFNSTTENPTAKLFWGRCSVYSAYSLLFFEKNKGSQQILFKLKYQSNPNVGVYFGKLLGEKVLNREEFTTIEVIIPVPLHPTKKYKRGYNQSGKIAKGISEITGSTINTSLITRKINSASQTTKTKDERWKNVVNAFTIDPKIKSFKHVCIVDDVITTGSTLESIIRQINQLDPTIKVSVLTLAIA